MIAAIRYETTRSCFSRAQFRKFLGLSVRSSLCMQRKGAIDAVGMAAVTYQPGGLFAWRRIDAIIASALAAYGASIVALAWLGG